MDATWSLGYWIKRRRKALDLTQRELAALVHCSVELISKIEADARRPSRDIAARLAEQLGLAPTEYEIFVRSARAEISVERLPTPTAEVVGATRIHASAPHDRPASLPTYLTSFIGRTQELASIRDLLRQPK